MNQDRLTTSPTTLTPCPVCEAKTADSVATFPFCSERCRKVDLGRWLKEDYRISRPVEQADLDEE